MTINRNAWSPEERDEYEDLLATVVAKTIDTSARLDLMDKLILDAIQAHRPWASEVVMACRRKGYSDEIRNYQGRMRVLVAKDSGEVLSARRVQGRKVRNEVGQVIDQQELIELWTWEQILEKRAEAIRERRAYTDKIAHYDKLLALRELAPDSTSPADAAKQLGVTLEAFLGPEEKAA